jgi:hypothetical protein
LVHHIEDLRIVFGIDIGVGLKEFVAKVDVDVDVPLTAPPNIVPIEPDTVMVIEAVIAIKFQRIVAAIHAEDLLEIDSGADQSIGSVEPDGSVGVTDQEGPRADSPAMANRLIVCRHRSG